jgi:3-hydroxyacyl-CoA dehydrogenase/enoyl-CoA hydratase/3-hydroxybutyryl-CoA epimerase
MGPIELVDTVGLDVALHVGRILAEASGREAPAGPAELVKAGRLGRKSGDGYYHWEGGKPVRPSTGGQAPPADLEDRLVLAFLNEAVACLREGVVADADLLDAGIIFGTGFAPFRGGPLNYARHRGREAIVARLRDLEHGYGARFRADEGWDTLPQLRS